MKREMRRREGQKAKVRGAGTKLRQRRRGSTGARKNGINGRTGN